MGRNVVASFVYADRANVPSYMLKGGRTYRIIADHLRSVRLVVDTQTGVVAQRVDYDESGNAAGNEGLGASHSFRTARPFTACIGWTAQRARACMVSQPELRPRRDSC